MKKIIACLDASPHGDSVCTVSQWAATATKLPVALLHVVAPHSERAAGGDLSGQIGLGAKSDLLEELTRLDQEHGKLEQKKGQLILDHARETLEAGGLGEIESLHRRGALLETIAELEGDADLIVIGKRGEGAGSNLAHLGSNLERLVRSAHVPILVAPRVVERTPKRFLLAYDGSEMSNKAVEYAVGSPLLKGLEGHILMVGEQGDMAQEALDEASSKLQAAGYSVSASIEGGDSVDSVVNGYIQSHNIDLLVMGAYGHSRIRSFLLGSTTTAQILHSKVPILLFR